jgi:hypothetical protein
VWSCLAACCHNDGSCNVLSLAACWATGDGTPLGYGVCEPKTPCPFAIGPCCLTNGTCTVTTRAQCDGTGGLDGVWQGTGVTCSGSACPPPRGACCVISQCTYTTQFLCGDRTWAGANTSCNPAARACCLADINRSNSVSVQDIFDFLAKYFEPNMAADFNRSCFLSVQDLFEFLAAYFTGCE